MPTWEKTTAGTETWTCPAGVTGAIVELWGVGGNGAVSGNATSGTAPGGGGNRDGYGLNAAGAAGKALITYSVASQGHRLVIWKTF